MLADFVVGAGGAQKASVEKELLSDEPGEVGRRADSGLEFAKFLLWLLAFAACQGDVGLVGASFRDEPAKRRGCHDALLKLEQFGREPDSGNENSGVVEDAQSLQLHRHGRQTQFVQARDQARVLFRFRIAEKLEGDMPGFRLRPAQAVRLGLKPLADRRQFAKDRGSQRNSDKEAHTKIMEP